MSSIVDYRPRSLVAMAARVTAIELEIEALRGELREAIACLDLHTNADTEECTWNGHEYIGRNS